MKIFERIFDRRIREIGKLFDNQCEFVSGCGTTDAIHAARLLVEKHREKQRPVHIAFLDSRELIWCALRQHNVPEKLTEWVWMLYSCPKGRVQAAAGTSVEFPILVGVHKGSAPSTLLFLSSWMLLREICISLFHGCCFMLMTRCLLVMVKVISRAGASLVRPSGEVRAQTERQEDRVPND
ncbi:unnamed protein product [Heligmosomoides polygyrus]|uniref:Reverse transcriptase domain-containing protein n=1 Tax=Heligmosomoides polygyrus TaxID=6339 RepID=A0A183G414_HELPZ|nr:unnamed protein product [Heligmosomoides polygyrus]